MLLREVILPISSADTAYKKKTHTFRLTNPVCLYQVWNRSCNWQTWY